VLNRLQQEELAGDVVRIAMILHQGQQADSVEIKETCQPKCKERKYMFSAILWMYSACFCVLVVTKGLRRNGLFTFSLEILFEHLYVRYSTEFCNKM
jgi:hypothetical protein